MRLPCTLVCPPYIVCSLLLAAPAPPCCSTCGAEDFSYFLEKLPGAFFFVGAALPGPQRPHHKSVFDFDEGVVWWAERCVAPRACQPALRPPPSAEAILVGASIFLNIVDDLLLPVAR